MPMAYPQPLPRPLENQVKIPDQSENLSRNSRRRFLLNLGMVGENTVTVDDYLQGRRFDDAVAYSFYIGGPIQPHADQGAFSRHPENLTGSWCNYSRMNWFLPASPIQPR
jgi:hypothetical protein